MYSNMKFMIKNYSEYNKKKLNKIVEIIRNNV